MFCRLEIPHYDLANMETVFNLKQVIKQGGCVAYEI